jgi:divalent metal cation (Fe/Co/Zn/Cd) transporter
MTRNELVKLESKAIKTNMIPIALMGVVGLVFGTLGNSSAVVLDGLFSTVLFITVIIASIIQKKAEEPTDYMYPQSHWLYENLYLLFKIMVLIVIVAYSLQEGVRGLFKYINGEHKAKVIDQTIINYYYIIKVVLVVIALSVYNKYIKLTNNTSEMLVLERKSVMIDGGITIAIALGFLILTKFDATKDISDEIVLTLLSIFLLKEVLTDFKVELDKIVGKRMYIEKEKKYLKILENKIQTMDILDIYIHYTGKMPIVSITASFIGSKSIEQVQEIEDEIKQIMKDDYDEIILYMYWKK